MTIETPPELQPPLVPAYVDLRSFTDIPVDAQRMVNSRAMRVIPDNAIRSWILLIYQSWSQLPTASLPDDDHELAHLAGFGRDVESWQAIRDDALYGWILCEDGRWYHPVVAEKALEAWQHKLRNRWYRLKPDEKKQFGGSFETWLPAHEKDLEKSVDGVAKLPHAYRGVTAKPTRSPRDTNATATRNVIGSDLIGTDRNGSDLTGTELKGHEGGAGGGAITPLSACADPNINTALSIYNEMAEQAGLPKAQRMTDKRNRAMKLRLTECGGIEGWQHACEMVRRSSFLTGQNKEGWRASFDFMLQKSSFTKIMEGTYDRGNGSDAQARRVLDQMRRDGDV